MRGVYLIAITHYLAAEDYGAWAYAIATYGFAMGAVGFGFEGLIPMWLGADRRRARAVAGVTLVLRLGLLGLGAAGIIIYALLVEPGGVTRAALLLTLPALVGRGLSLWARAVFLGHERVGAFVRMAAGMRLLEVVGGTALLAGGAGLFGILLLHSAVWACEGAIGLVMVRRQLVAVWPRFAPAEAWRILRQGAVLGVAALFGAWLMAGPVLLLRHVDGDLAQLGQVALALQLSMIGVASVQAFLAAAMPVLSRSQAQGDPRVDVYGHRIALLSTAIFAGGAALAFWIGPALVALVFGPDFALAGRLLGPCLLIGGLILLPVGYGQTMVTRERRWPGAVAGGAGALVLLAALPPAAAAHGVEGALAATAAAWLARALVVIAVFVRMPRHAAGSAS